MIFFSDADQIVQRDVIRSHQFRHDSVGADAAVIGSVFGRRCFTLFTQEIRAEHQAKLLDLLRFDKRFDDVAALMACGERIELGIPEASIWESLSDLSFAEPWRATWGELILMFGEDLRGFPHRWSAVVSASMSLPRRTFTDLGGFDESLHSMEDWEFGMRLQEQGVGILAAPEAEPYHQVHPVHPRRAERDSLSLERIQQKHAHLLDSVLRSYGSTRPPAADILKQVSIVKNFDSELIERHCESFVSITFDCGFNPRGSLDVLDALDSSKCRSTFFFLGEQVLRDPELCRLISERGHAVGVQRWQEGELSELTVSEIAHEIGRTLDELRTVCHAKITFGRPSIKDDYSLYEAAASTVGLKAVQCDIYAATRASPSRWSSIRALASKSLRGKVIGFHLTRADPEVTVESLRWLLSSCSRCDIEILDLQEHLSRREALDPYKDISAPTLSLADRRALGSRLAVAPSGR